MMKCESLNKKYKLIICTVIFLIYVFVFLLNPLIGDDFGKHSGGIIESFETSFSLWKYYNGRYMGNALVVFFKEYQILKSILQASTVVMIIYILSNYKNNKKTSFLLACLLIILMPIGIYKQSVAWLSGFVNFSIPACGFLLMFYMIEHCMADSYKNKIFAFLISFLLLNGYSEHSSIMSVLIPIVLILYKKLNGEKIYEFYYYFVLGGIVGCFFMFASPSYWLGLSRVSDEFSNLSLFGKIYYTLSKTTFIKDLTFKNTVFNILISFYFLRKLSSENRLMNKIITILLSVLSIIIFPYISFIGRLSFLNGATIGLFFTGIYWLSILYLLITNINDRKELFYLILLYFLAVFCATPLLLAQGIGPRCFYNTYMFYSMFIIRLYSYENYIGKALEKVILIIIFTFIVLLNYMTYQNYLVAKQRENIIKNNKKDTIILPCYKYSKILHQDGKISTNYHINVYKEYYNIPKEIAISFSCDK